MGWWLRVQRIVLSHQAVLAELDYAPLFLCNKGEALSSKDNRLRQTSIGSKLVSALRDALGCDCAVLNAGNIRANKAYHPTTPFFHYNDLKASLRVPAAGVQGSGFRVQGSEFRFRAQVQGWFLCPPRSLARPTAAGSSLPSNPPSSPPCAPRPWRASRQDSLHLLDRATDCFVVCWVGAPGQGYGGGALPAAMLP
jgi:hypothetical protein